MNSGVSILSSPKSFEGQFRSIQERAIESWKIVDPSAEIILYGKAEGLAEVAKRHGSMHVPEVACSKSGAPLFNAIATHARDHARYDLQIYLNADIVLPPNLLSRFTVALPPQFLISGQRIDLDQRVAWDISGDWDAQLTNFARENKAELHPAYGMDYFIFPRGMWNGLKELVIGRGGYDNALLAFCFRQGIPVIDATPALTVIHQWHGYSHVAGGKQEAHNGQEAAQNRILHDVVHSPPMISDADWVLEGGTLREGSCRGDRIRRMEILLRYRHNVKFLSYIVRIFWTVKEAMKSRMRRRAHHN